jgi:trimeric autotransporter adhesin
MLRSLRRPTCGDHGAGVRRLQRRAAVCLLALALSLVDLPGQAASEHRGQVTFGSLPVPGATVTAIQGEKQFVTITDQEGVYVFTDLQDGAWTFRVEMLGFAIESREIVIGSDTPSPVWELRLLPLEEITRGIASANNATAAATAATDVRQTTGPATSTIINSEVPRTPDASKPTGSQRGDINAATGAATAPRANEAGTTPADAAAGSNDDLNERAATGLLVNGSVNNGGASPFAQMAAFGNNRRGPGALYNGGIGVIFDTSAWDAAPYSQTGLAAAKPSYTDTQIVGALGGPFGIPHHLVSASNFFVAYQHASNDTAAAQWGRVPTVLERAGNFSQTVDAAGHPVQIFNLSTGLPFPGNMIPANLISPQAQALLNLYPLPNAPTTGLYNDQATVLNSLQQDAAQARLTKSFGFRDQIFGNMAYQRGTTDARNLFGFDDTTTVSGLDTAVNWSHRLRGIFNSTFFILHFKYEFSRLTTDVTPFFANRANLSGESGILGNDQESLNWGPPNLIFSGGVAGLSEPEYARNANQTNAFSYDTLWGRGRHNFMFGGDLRRRQFNILSQQDARGTLAFTGAATQITAKGLPVAGSGSDLADFLLGIPDTASIAFGNADKYLRGWIYDAFFNDDWRINSGFTLNAGVRWEYAAPFTELRDRLVNLDVAPGFGVVALLLASDPTGAISDQTYPSSLVRSDYRGVEPRIGLAWRPKPASAMVVRAGYGVYDNTSVYQLLATQLAQQPPLSKTLSIQNSAANPLTLATAFNTVPVVTTNTFAVDPNFRVGYAQNWTLSVQEDLPASMTMTATYLGTKGTRLMQESLPNTFPLGGINPCSACPDGFIYLSSNGNSIREAGQIQLRRRLRDGWTALAQYTYSKSIDDASAFSGAGVTTTNTSAAPPAASNANSGSAPIVSNTAEPRASVAQNWLDLEGERGLSAFDQRHLLNFQLQYTSGEGLRGGAFLRGWAGSLLKEWTFTTQLTVGSGLPLTPIYLTNVTGTGVVGTIRPNYTGAAVSGARAGFFLNPAGYTAPSPGQWGNAGRDSITGPAQFALNASLGRTFRLNNRLHADWRIDATNALNVVTYTAWNTTVNSPLFGLPTQANPMRKLQTTFRMRF